MRKILFTLAILISANCFSQAITVNTTTYTVPQLVNSVLINSPCVSGTNITWKTGSNFGSTNGIGYFENTNSNFPMQSGVILSTGNVMNAPGPNTSMLSDGASTWPGDSDLEATLAQSGINMLSKNATVLEFNFTPISSSFSFDFVFASEEYGNFQCQFSDAFAFLLTNMNTGVTTNLAIVPGTSLPISVVTIRNLLYNSSCTSENASYFGSYNGGSGSASSATNFNGQTVLMSAGSSLVPNTPYHIKLVVADRNDPLSDSAIFLSSTSFNIGQDVLGPDLTIQNQTAICYGVNHTIDTGLSPATYSFSWSKDGVTIPNEMGSALTINTPGVYAVTYNNIVNPCQAITDSIKIEYYPEIVVQNPNDIYKCNMGQATYQYDLTLNTSIVKSGSNASAQVAYFVSILDANTNTNALSSPYTSAGNQTIYVRVSNGTCFTVKTFQLLVSAPPVANPSQDMVLCERTLTIHNAIFNLLNQNNTVLNGQSSAINIVSYYISQSDANAGINSILLPYYIGSNGTTIFVRVQNVSDSSCYSTNGFNLIVNPLPPVDKLDDIIVCTNYTLPTLTNGNYFTASNGGGTPLFAGNVITQTQTIYIFNQPNGPNTCSSETSFKVTIVDLNTLDPGNQNVCDSYTLPPPDYASYYTQPDAMGTQLHGGDQITTSQTIYLYYKSLEPPFCIAQMHFDVTIIQSPFVPDYPNIFSCDNYTLPTLGVGKYYTGSNASGTEIASGTVISSTQTIYVYAETTTTPKCSSQDSFTVFIGLDPIANVSDCVSYTLPPLPIGNYYTGPNGTGNKLDAGTVITATQPLYVHAISSSGQGCVNDVLFTVTISLPFIDSASNFTSCGSYTLPSLSSGNYYTAQNGGGTALFAGNIITQTKTIYIFISNGSGCQNEKPINITINPLPQIDPRSDHDECNSYELTPLMVGQYYTGPDGTGNIIPFGTIINTTQKIYIYAVSSSTPPCVAQNSFIVTIYHAYADAPANVTKCDSYVLPNLTANNKYYTQTNGPNGNGTEIPAGTTITATQTIFVYAQNQIRQSFYCSAENSFTIIINHSPVVPTVANVNACKSYTLPALTVGNYYTQTGGAGTLLHADDVITENKTLYVFAETGTAPNCTDEKSFTVSLFKVDELPSVTNCSGFILPSISIGKYYTGSQGTGTQFQAGNNITSTQTIYIYANSPYANCYDETSFVVTIIPQPVAYPVPVANRTVCDTDGTNDGQFLFNLSSITPIILGGQTTAEFNLAYYANIFDANSQTNPLSSTTTLQFFYVRVNNSLAPNCFDIKNILIIVNKIPEPILKNGVICIDNVTGNVNNPYTVMTGLSATTHTFVWTNENGLIVGNTNSLLVTIPGNYTLIATNIATGCSSLPTQAQVIVSQPALVSYTTNEGFSDNQIITILASGSGGDYEYQLDNGNFQDSNVFENTAFGSHSITVRDKFGCGISTIDALLVNYPKYFTPNGDGYNDNWNVIGLSAQTEAKVAIFDRYGKFLKQFSPNELGWDGIYNGQQMPSDDYWFTVSYQEKGDAKEFKSHFSMKR